MRQYAVIGLVWLASLAAVGAWQNNSGHVSEQADWLKRENAALTVANTKIAELNNAAREAERIHVDALAEIATDYERKLSNAKKQNEADAAAVRAGTLRLYDNAAGLRACGSVTAQVGASACQCDGTQGGELSSAASEFLLGLANEADGVVEQLGECQAVVRADRAM